VGGQQENKRVFIDLSLITKREKIETERNDGFRMPALGR
jgi:hypothetical protein